MSGPYRLPAPPARCAHAMHVVKTHHSFAVTLHVACAWCGERASESREAWLLLLWWLGVSR